MKIFTGFLAVCLATFMTIKTMHHTFAITSQIFSLVLAKHHVSAQSYPSELETWNAGEKGYDSPGGWYSFTPEKPVKNGSCHLTFSSQVKYFELQKGYLVADYPIPDLNTFRWCYPFDASDYTAADETIEFKVLLDENSVLGVSDMEVTCQSDWSWEYSLYPFPRSPGDEENKPVTGIRRFRGVNNSPYQDSSYSVYFGEIVYDFNFIVDKNVKIDQTSVNTYYVSNIDETEEVLWFEFEFSKTKFTSNQLIINFDKHTTTIPDTTLEPTSSPKTTENPVTEFSTTEKPTSQQSSTEKSTTLPTHKTRLPSCTPKKDSVVNWHVCSLDRESDSWYGLSNRAMTYEQALQTCASLSPTEQGVPILINDEPVSQLVSIHNETVDKCLFDIYRWVMPADRDIDFLYSLQYLDVFGSAYWMKYDGVSDGTKVSDGEFGDSSYKHWFVGDDEGTDNLTVNNSCVTGVIPAGGNRGFTENYGWKAVPCDEPRRFVCRVDCAMINPTPVPPTPNPSFGVFARFQVVIVLSLTFLL